MPSPASRPRAMRATPHTSWPWPEKAWRTGLGAGRRAEEEARPLGAAERPLEEVDLERELEDDVRLELERLDEERCFVATWSRFVRGPHSARRGEPYRRRPRPAWTVGDARRPRGTARR